MTRELLPHFLRIQRALDRIDRNRPPSRQEFLSSELLQSEILMQLFQIGESLSHIRRIDPKLFDNAPESWHQLAGLRNIIAHGYEIIDQKLIWGYLESELDEFVVSVEKEIAKL